MEKVGRQALPVRHIQMLNPSKAPDWGLFSFGFKGRWQGHPPFGDRALDVERVSEWPAFLFERPSTATGWREISSHFQWVDGFMGSPRSRNIPVTATNTKAQGGQNDGFVAADRQVRRKRPKRAWTLPEISNDDRRGRRDLRAAVVR